jgi:hypothetical protein
VNGVCIFVVAGGSIKTVSPNVGGLRSGNERIVIVDAASGSFLFALRTDKALSLSLREYVPSPGKFDLYRAGVALYWGRYRLRCMQADTNACFDRERISRKPTYRLLNFE